MKRTPIIRKTRLRSRTKAEKAARTRRLKSKAAANGIGLLRSIERAAIIVQRGMLREACVSFVRARDVLCRCGCGRVIDDVHEEPPRSKGGDPTNPDHCVGLSRVCHDARHFKAGRDRLRIRPLVPFRTSGPIEFSQGGRVWQTIVRPGIGTTVLHR